MRGWLAGAAEVVRIARDGLAKVPQPEPVHDGARGERIACAGDPVSEGFPAAFDAFGELFGHLYFQAPHGAAIRNSAGKLAPGVDVRAAGGYVIAAGSVLEHG